MLLGKRGSCEPAGLHETISTENRNTWLWTNLCDHTNLPRYGHLLQSKGEDKDLDDVWWLRSFLQSSVREESWLPPPHSPPSPIDPPSQCFTAAVPFHPCSHCFILSHCTPVIASLLLFLFSFSLLLPSHPLQEPCCRGCAVHFQGTQVQHEQHPLEFFQL